MSFFEPISVEEKNIKTIFEKNESKLLVSKFELRNVPEFSEEWKNTKNSILFTSSPPPLLR